MLRLIAAPAKQRLIAPIHNDGLQQQCHMTLLVFLVVTPRNLLHVVFQEKLLQSYKK